jgi:hypothetical protein
MRKLPISKLAIPAAIAASLLAPLFSSAASPTKWVEIRSPNFVLVSNADQALAQNTAVQFEQMRALFLNSRPDMKVNPSPVFTILAMKDDDSFRALLPEYYSSGKDPHLGGLFISGYDLYQVAVDMGTKAANPYESIYHQYFHMVTAPYFSGLPTWIAEGFADFYGNTGMHEKTASMGMANGNLIEQLRRNKLIPLDMLFKVDQSSTYYNEQNKVSIFYAESWALVQYLKLADNGAHSAALDNYLDALSKGASEDEAAKAFGDLAVLEKAFDSYVKYLPTPPTDVPAPAKLPDEDFHTRSLSDAEANAYSGGYLTLHYQFKDAEPLLDQAVKLDPKLALAQRNLALLHFFKRENSAAMDAVTAAVALDPQDATSRYLRAELTFESGSHNDPQIEQDLRQALGISPDFAAANALLALYLAADDDKLPEALALAQKAVSTAPGDPGFQLAVSQVLLRMRRYDEAEAMGQSAKKNTTDANVRAQVDQFLGFLKQEREGVGAVPEASANAAPQQPKLGQPEEKAEGEVTQVRCDGGEIQITLKTEDNAMPQLFHAADRTQIGYSSDTPSIHGGIEPCSQLKGHTVKIVFNPPASKIVQGELVHIEITE